RVVCWFGRSTDVLVSSPEDAKCARSDSLRSGWEPLRLGIGVGGRGIEIGSHKLHKLFANLCEGVHVLLARWLCVHAMQQRAGGLRVATHPSKSEPAQDNL